MSRTDGNGTYPITGDVPVIWELRTGYGCREHQEENDRADDEQRDRSGLGHPHVEDQHREGVARDGERRQRHPYIPDLLDRTFTYTQVVVLVEKG